MSTISSSSHGLMSEVHSKAPQIQHTEPIEERDLSPAVSTVVLILDTATKIGGSGINTVKLHKNGVTDIIIDMQGNDGSYISFASSIVQMFFPNKSLVLDSTNPGRTSTMHLVTLTIPSDSFTPTTISSPSQPPPPETGTNDASQIRLLTDSRCAGSCSMSDFFFIKFHNIISYAIGAQASRRLSGPYRGYAYIPVMEMFAPGSQVPLNYDPKQFPADNRLNYTPQNARHRDVMWNEIATLANWS
ncbi:hypothetical protein BGX29_010913 [Mortierella sp. GBA35]|nr:hypothetical protein BGX29_010913 [Mortierella sp. GBA35]